MGQSRPLLLFSSFSCNNFNHTNSNPGPQNGGRRRNHRAIATALLGTKTVIRWCLIRHWPKRPWSSRHSRRRCRDFCTWWPRLSYAIMSDEGMARKISARPHYLTKRGRRHISSVTKHRTANVLKYKNKITGLFFIPNEPILFSMNWLMLQHLLKAINKYYNSLAIPK